MADVHEFSERVIDLAERTSAVADAAQGKKGGRRGIPTGWLLLPAAGAGLYALMTNRSFTRQAKNVTTVVLTIKSLKEEGGKWTAEALAGRNLVNLENEKTMVGTVTLTTASGGSRGDRDRPVKLEKVEKK